MNIFICNRVNINVSGSFSILNSYPKGNSNIRGEFLILNEDPSLCLTFTEQPSPVEFIFEDDISVSTPPTPPTPPTPVSPFIIFGAGQGNVGQFGNGQSGFNYEETFFIPISGIWDSIAVGGSHTLAIKNNELYVTGRNDLGQLGLGDNTFRTTFTKVTGDWGFVDKIVCGGNTSFVRQYNTNIWYACGQNDSYQLGLGTNSSTLTFTRVLSEWSIIQATGNRTILKSGIDGEWYGCGGNFAGLLGVRRWITVPDENEPQTEQKCNGIQADVNTVTIPTRITNLRRNPTCIGITCPRFAVPKRFDFMYQRSPTTGITLAWGYKKIYECEIGDYNALYYKDASNDPEREFGDLWHQLPIGVLPVKIVSGNTIGGHIVILADNNKLYGWGIRGFFGMANNNTFYNSLIEITSLPEGEIIDIAASALETYVIIKNPITQVNQLFTTGVNTFGQLGLGDKNSRTFYQPASTSYFMALEGNITSVFSDGASNFVIAASGIPIGEG